MGKKITLKERIRNIEKFLVEGFFAIGTYYFYYSSTILFNKNEIPMLVVIIGAMLTLYYQFKTANNFSRLLVIDKIEGEKEFEIFLDKHISKIRKIVVIIILSVGVISSKYLMDVQWKYIFGTILLTIICAYLIHITKDFFKKK